MMPRTLYDFDTPALCRRFCLCFEELVVDACSYGITENSTIELRGRLKRLRTHIVTHNDSAVVVIVLSGSLVCEPVCLRFEVLVQCMMAKEDGVST